MAIKRVLNITVNYKSGTTIDLTGDDAQRVIQAYQRRNAGSIEKTVPIKQADGSIDEVDFDCLCGYKLKETTEDTAPDAPCGTVDCL